MHKNDNSLFIWLCGIYIVSNLVASGIYESLSAGFLINGLAIFFLVVLAGGINSSLSLLKREIINYKASEHTEKDLKNVMEQLQYIQQRTKHLWDFILIMALCFPCYAEILLR